MGKLRFEFFFCNNEKETANLHQNYTSLINTIIISPPNCGKIAQRNFSPS